MSPRFTIYSVFLYLKKISVLYKQGAQRATNSAPEYNVYTFVDESDRAAILVFRSTWKSHNW